MYFTYININITLVIELAKILYFNTFLEIHIFSPQSNGRKIIMKLNIIPCQFIRMFNPYCWYPIGMSHN